MVFKSERFDIFSINFIKAKILLIKTKAYSISPLFWKVSIEIRLQFLACFFINSLQILNIVIEARPLNAPISSMLNLVKIKVWILLYIFLCI